MAVTPKTMHWMAWAVDVTCNSSRTCECMGLQPIARAMQLNGTIAHLSSAQYRFMYKHTGTQAWLTHVDRSTAQLRTEHDVLNVELPMTQLQPHSPQLVAN